MQSSRAVSFIPIMTESLSPGDFYLFCPPGSRLGAGGLFGSLGRTMAFTSKGLERATQERVDSLIRCVSVTICDGRGEPGA